jgi:hypothetical protein
VLCRARANNNGYVPISIVGSNTFLQVQTGHARVTAVAHTRLFCMVRQVASRPNAFNEPCSYFWDYLELLSAKQTTENAILKKYKLPKFNRPSWAQHYKRASAAETVQFDLSRCLSHLVTAPSLF